MAHLLAAIEKEDNILIIVILIGLTHHPAQSCTGFPVYLADRIAGAVLTQF